LAIDLAAKAPVHKKTSCNNNKTASLIICIGEERAKYIHTHTTPVQWPKKASQDNESRYMSILYRH
jgi:hypothetical protein